MVALTTTMPSFSDPPDSFYPPQELPGPRLSAADPGARRQESPHTDELHSRDKGSDMLNFSETFQTISGELYWIKSLNLFASKTALSRKRSDLRVKTHKAILRFAASKDALKLSVNITF